MADRSGIKVTASDALEFESVAPKVRKGGSVIKTFLFIVIAVFAGAGGWAFYGERLVALFGDSEGEVPVIRADLSPIKVRPENPGGLQVPDRDKLVYDRIQNGGGGDAGRATVERLLPPPETPLPLPKAATTAENRPSQAVPLTPAPMPPTPKLSDVEAAVKPAPAPPAPAVPAAPAARPSLNQLNAASQTSAEPPANGPTRLAKGAEPTPVPPAAAAATPAPAQSVAAVSPPPPPARAAVQTPTSKVYRVQLAAARTADAARSEWDRLRRGNLDLLGDLGLSVTKIDLGGTKGVFYRLRAGPLDDDAQARALCKELAKRKVGCLVVRPGK